MSMGLHEKIPFQAILLTDLDDDHLQPAIQDDPKVLLPLVNNALINYTLGWLERCGIEEVFIYCTSQSTADKLKKHCRFNGEQECQTNNRMILKYVTSEDCHSVGDAMRDLYAKSLLKSDFILIHGDLVANVDLKSVMRKHKDQRSVDKSNIMTCVFLPAVPSKKDSALGEPLCNLIVDSRCGKILQHSRPSRKLNLMLPTELLADYSQIGLMPRLRDPGIYVCSEVVPSLFSDNFDYGSADSLVKGVIEQEELLGYSIYCHILQKGYARRVANWNCYEGISCDVIDRLAFPNVPESHPVNGHVRYSFDPFTGNYWHPEKAQFRGNLCSKSVIGKCDLAVGVEVASSVIGDGVVVGVESKLEKSFVLDGTTVEANSALQHCFISANSLVHSGTQIESGSVLGPKVIVGPNVKIEHTHVIRVSNLKEVDRETLGTNSNGRVYKQIDEEGKEMLHEWGVEGEDEELGVEEEESEEGESDDEVDGGEHYKDEDEEREKEFKHELMESLVNTLREKSPAENVILEINSSRHAYNIGMDDVLLYIVQGLLQVAEHLNCNMKERESVWKVVHHSLVTFKVVLANYVRRSHDQIVILNALEHLVNKNRCYLCVMTNVFLELNQKQELLDDDVITGWFKKGGAATGVFGELREQVAKFLAWLEEEGSDEETDEEESD